MSAAANTPGARARRASQRQTLLRVLRYIQPQLWSLVLSLGLTLATVVLSLLVPILIGRAIDCMTGAGTVFFEGLLTLLFEIFGCVAASSLFQYLSGLLINRLTFRTVQDIRRDAFAHLQTLPLRFLDRQPVGDTVSRMITDVDTFADGLLLGFTQLFSGAMTIAGTLFFMVRLSPLIALAVFLLTPLSLLTARFIARKTFPCSSCSP